MSIQVDCPSCMAGNHERHDRDWGIIPGLIGGQSCGCRGDCAERAEAAFEEFGRWWSDLKLYGEDGALLEPATLTSYDGPIEESGTDEELEDI